MNQDRTMPEIRQTLIEMCRPFGGLEHWTIESANDGLYRCIVRLGDPENHRLLAQTLGGTPRGEEVCLEIRLRERRAGVR